MPCDDWISALDSYSGGIFRKSISQLMLTLIVYISLLFAMFYIILAGLPYWIALLVSIPAAGFQVRLFIIMHDCGHNSFFKSQLASVWVGRLCGFHHIHHLNSRIPNYNLRKCYNRIPELRNIKPLTMSKSIQSAFLTLWDESTGKLVNYRRLKDFKFP